MLKLVSLHINTDQPELLGKFYQGVLRQEPAWSANGVTGFLLGDFRLEIAGHDQVAGRNNMPARHFFDLMVDDVQAEFARITGLGATPIQQPYTFTEEDLIMSIATVADLDGNYF